MISSLIVLGVYFMTRISCNKQEPTHDVILGNVYSQRLMQGLQPYSQLSDFITSVSLLNVQTLDNSTREDYMSSTDNSINQAIQATEQYLINQPKQTNVTHYNDSQLCITTQKSSEVDFASFLQQPPAFMLGESLNQSDIYPIDAVFSITEITFKQNPYKATITFPYPKSTFQVALLFFHNTYNISTLPLPLPFIFDTGMVYTGTSNDTANQAKLLQYTNLMTCLIRNGSSFWVSDGITKQTLFHPEGKVLIQCNSNTSNLPVTIVNDTKYLYNNNPSGNVDIKDDDDDPVYLAFYTAAMFWIIIVVTLLWAFFIYFGYNKDQKTRTFVQERSGMNKIVNKDFQGQISIDGDECSPERNDTGMIDQENHGFQKSQRELSNEETKNSFVIQFDGDDLNVVRRKKIQDVPVSYQKRSNDEEQKDQNIILTPDEQLKLYSKIKVTPIVFYHYRGVGDNDYDQEVVKLKSLSSLNVDVTPALKPDIEIEIQDTNTIEPEEDGLLPPLDLKIFTQIFLRFHDLYSIFYQYQKDLSRVLRFLINYCRTILIIAFSSYIDQNLSLILNLLVMLLGLIIANLVSHVAAIVLKHKGRLYRVLGIFVLALDMAIALYIIITSLMTLLPHTRDIWLYTYIIITLIDWIFIELVVTGLKTAIQPHLSVMREKKDDAIASIVCVMFWDSKLQSIWRRTYRFEGQLNNQFNTPKNLDEHKIQNDLHQSLGEFQQPIILSHKDN